MRQPCQAVDCSVALWEKCASRVICTSCRWDDHDLARQQQLPALPPLLSTELMRMTQTSANANIFPGVAAPALDRGAHGPCLTAPARAASYTSAQSHFTSRTQPALARAASKDARTGQDQCRWWFWRMETSTSTWSSMKWVRSFWTTGRHLSDLDSGKTRLALGMPATCSNPAVSEQRAGV